jgi:hypothetical protein
MTYHRLFAARHVVIRECKVVDEKRAGHDNGRREQDAQANTSVDDWLILLPRWLAHHCVIDRIDAKRLARGAYNKKSLDMVEIAGTER